MFPASNYVWKCEDCGEELAIYQDENFLQLGAIPPKCSKCDGEMVGNPIVHQGPFPEGPFKKL